MNAIVHRRYGTPDVLNPVTIDRPDPGPSQILVRVEAASLNAADLLAIAGKPLFVRFASGGLRRPRRTVPGSDVAGIVEACGPDSGRWRPGDRVVADLSGSGLGGLAEFVAVSRYALVRIPDGVSFEQAAAAPTAASTALQALRETADVHPGDRILIDGASGGVGTFAVQIAKALGAHVTAVCGSSKADTAREIGADVVIPRGSEHILLVDDEKDLVVMLNVFEGQQAQRTIRVTTTLRIERDLDSGLLAMSQAVGFTASIVAQMIATKQIDATGVLSPTRDIPYQAFVDALDQRGIRIDHTEQVLA